MSQCIHISEFIVENGIRKNEKIMMVWFELTHGTVCLNKIFWEFKSSKKKEDKREEQRGEGEGALRKYIQNLSYFLKIIYAMPCDTIYPIDDHQTSYGSHHYSN